MKGIEIHNEFFKTTTWEKESTTLLSSPRPSSTSSLSFSFAFVAEAAADLSFYVLSFSNKRGKKASNEPVRDVHQSYLRLPFPAVGVVTINIHEKTKASGEEGRVKERTSAGVSSGWTRLPSYVNRSVPTSPFQFQRVVKGE